MIFSLKNVVDQGLSYIYRSLRKSEEWRDYTAVC